MKATKLLMSGAMMVVCLAALWFAYILVFPALNVDALYHYDEPVRFMGLREQNGSTVARLEITRYSLISAQATSTTILQCDTTLPVAEKRLPIEQGAASWLVDFDFLWATVNGGTNEAECYYRGVVTYRFLGALISYSWHSETFEVPRPTHSPPTLEVS